MKGVSIPINTLVMLAVAIIVLLAAVAWFMGAFAPTASQQTYKQKFDSACTSWVSSNCALDGSSDDVPDAICNAYNDLMQSTATTCTHATVAAACGCTAPYGTERAAP